MNGYEFTWLSAMKLLGGILLAVVWYMMRKQAMLDKKYREENEKAGQAHGSEPVPSPHGYVIQRTRPWWRMP